ncbi:S-layer homology domain-containing protein [Citricoccus sp. GCM10030269]|uniref:S-layer homology domain-containing protein n=1 Tax=Citricoccus sp. GCM10030269 TaxID=3273388 RepID=UPI0036116132
MSDQNPARTSRPRYWRLLATALSLGLLIPGAVVSAPAFADSENVNPLDQSTEFDDDLPVLDDAVVESLEGLDSIDKLDAPSGHTEGSSRSDSGSAAPATTHLGPCKQDFVDAPPDGMFYRAITWMACDGLTVGYTDGSFGRALEITRGETAQFLYRMSGEHHDPGTQRDFTDVNPGGAGFTAISWMEENGYTVGRTDGSFGINDEITRGELAQFMYGLSGESGPAPSTSPYSDMTPESGFYRAAAWLHSTNLVAGYADGTFRTRRDITRGETAQFLFALESYLHGTPAPPSTPPKPAVPLAYRYVVIADDGLNVRTGPGSSYSRITALARNTKVVITGRSRSVGGATWREITAGSVKGWVHGGYLMRDFEAGNAKSSLSRTGSVRTPSTRNGVTRLSVDHESQPNGYYCGPASITIALSAFGINTNQAAMAEQAQTDTSGTWLHQVARVMDYNAPASVRYTVTTIPGSSQKASYDQRIQFRDDMVRSVKAGVPGLVNIAATPGEQAPLHRQKTEGRFILRHHMPVVGYDEKSNDLLVSDPWTKPFWVDAYKLADMTVTRGYATLKR